MLSFIRNLSDGHRRFLFVFLFFVSFGVVLNVWAWYVGSLLTPTSLVVVTNGQQYGQTATVADASGVQLASSNPFSFFQTVKSGAEVVFDAIVSIIK